MPISQDVRFDRLEGLIEKGFAAIADDIAQSRAEVVQFRTEMQEGFANIQAELKEIRHRLDELEAAVKNVAGFAKEIDHLIQRVSAIEKHLGIHHSIAA